MTKKSWQGPSLTIIVGNLLQNSFLCKINCVCSQQPSATPRRAGERFPLESSRKHRLPLYAGNNNPELLTPWRDDFFFKCHLQHRHNMHTVPGQTQHMHGSRNQSHKLPGLGSRSLAEVQPHARYKSRPFPCRIANPRCPSEHRGWRPHGLPGRGGRHRNSHARFSCSHLVGTGTELQAHRLHGPHSAPVGYGWPVPEHCLPWVLPAMGDWAPLTHQSLPHCRDRNRDKPLAPPSLAVQWLPKCSPMDTGSRPHCGEPVGGQRIHR